MGICGTVQFTVQKNFTGDLWRPNKIISLLCSLNQDYKPIKVTWFRRFRNTCDLTVFAEYKAAWEGGWVLRCVKWKLLWPLAMHQHPPQLGRATYFPTKFSSTELFPALWPPTTAICGRSRLAFWPMAEKASCIRFTSGIKSSIPRFPMFAV